MSEEAESRRLRWRCRRGMRELDQLLLRYLERRWPLAGAAEREAFERLLDCEDDRLWRWFLSREAPESKDLEEIVARVLELA